MLFSEQSKKGFELINPGIISVNEKLKIIWCNEKACEYCSLEKIDLENHSINEINLLAPLRPLLKKRFSSRKNEVEHITLIGGRQTGEQFQLQITIFGGSEEFSKNCILLLVDRTHITRFQESLIHAQRLQALGSLMGGFAHDFNNVFTGILSHLDFAIYSPECPASLKEYLLTAQSAARRGASVVNKLQSLVLHSDAGVAPYDVGELISELIFVMRHCLGRKIKIADFQKPSELCLAHINASALFHALVNICINARDAMPQGGELSIHLNKTTLLSSQNKNQADTYWKITISDTGTGMTEDVKSRLFTPFFTTKPENRGIGLGLFTTLKIIESMGGFIEVESHPGAGTKFHIYLPAVVSTLISVESRPTTPSIPQDKLKGKESILIVDDEEFIRNVLKKTLTLYGYKTAEAGSVAEINSLINTGSLNFELIFIDVNLGDGCGLNVIPFIKRCNPAVKIVLLSGGLSDKELEVAESLEIDGFLNKPFFTYDVLQVVRATIDFDKKLQDQE